MNEPRICASLVDDDLEAARQVEPLVDLYEVRIDLIGDGWETLAGQLSKPWIACNRSAAEGGGWQDTETRRIEKLLQAMEMGAAVVDIELSTGNLDNVVRLIKRRTECLISHHDYKKTPAPADMKQIMEQQVEAGTDICKVVTTALGFEDNLNVLRLITENPDKRIVAFAMGPIGTSSRVLSPLVGGDFTYASVQAGKEAAAGQVTAEELRNIYSMVVK